MDHFQTARKPGNSNCRQAGVLIVADHPSSQRAEARAYVEQAFDFCEAASNPQLGSKPLLYYYAFLNLVKVLLLHQGVPIPPAARHGIADPRANIRERFRFEGQMVSISGRAGDHSELFPELIVALGGTVTGPRKIRILNVFSQLPSMHRTFSQISGQSQALVPVERIELRRRRARVWSRVILHPTDPNTQKVWQTIKKRNYFRGELKQVASEADSESWFETEDLNCKGRAADPAIASLARSLRNLRLSTMLTVAGYRYYLSSAKAGDFLPPVAASLAAIFYLGSITRYKPADFDKLRAGKYGWVCEELLAAQPRQLLYSMASAVAGVDVVAPHAVMG